MTDKLRIVKESLQVTAHLRYKNLLKENWRSQSQAIVIQQRELLAAFWNYKELDGKTSDARPEWRQTFRKMIVVVGLARQDIRVSDRPFHVVIVGDGAKSFFVRSNKL